MNSIQPAHRGIEEQTPRTATPPLGSALTARLRAIAAAHCAEEGSCHGSDHADRVHATALLIGREMRANLRIISAAALLHDIGRREESLSRGGICHAALGAELAEPILAELAFTGEEIEAIRHCISTHRFRADNPPESLEARILFDADKLDSLGAIGIGRAFLFAGQVGARLHNTEAALAGSSAYTIEDTAYREFRFKLRKLRERMLTPLGRQLADERHRFMEEFFKRLNQEIGEGERDVQES
jgi:uncharacterized protein